jgi:hypothetical protein
MPQAAASSLAGKVTSSDLEPRADTRPKAFNLLKVTH